jgi:hypothetical protein
MKSIFNPTDNQLFIDRINQLRPDSLAKWGKMDVAQMLTHLQQPMRVAFGELKLKRTFIGFLLGRIAKKKLTIEEPWKRNMPTDKHYVIIDKRNFEEEKLKLIALVQRFPIEGKNAISKGPHPFFGPLTPAEWDALTANHLNHHLTQFGA